MNGNNVILLLGMCAILVAAVLLLDPEHPVPDRHIAQPQACEPEINKYVLPDPHETLDPGTSTAILFDAW